MTTATLPPEKFDANMVFVRPETPPTRVALDTLAVLPGFNTRVKDDEYNSRVAGIAESIVANGYFDDKPLAVTMLPNDSTVYIYDGEHRFDAAKLASLDGAEFPNGLPVAWAKDGATVRDLTIHLAHGNNGERLSMVELAAVVRRMQGIGMSKEEIATALGRTTRHVDNLFVLAAANQTVKKAVASGQIAAAEAVKLLRKDPKTAAAKITEAVKAAAEKGKAKATPKTMTEGTGTADPKVKTKTTQMSMNLVPGKKMGDMLKEVATMIREFVAFNKGDDLCTEAALIRFSVTTTDHEAEAARAKRDAEKAEAAKKRADEKAKRDAEKAEAAKKREAEKKLLAEAATGKGKPAADAPKTRRRMARPAEGQTAVKPATGGKAAGAATKPAGAKKGTAATSIPAAAADASSGANPPALGDESMGGL